MKTISLTESAYQRLASYKEGRTFSQVIERMIPLKGKIEAAFEAVGNLPDLSAKDFDELEKAVDTARQPLPAAWS
jgi:predicted CopG family antitoxin